MSENIDTDHVVRFETDFSFAIMCGANAGPCITPFSPSLSLPKLVMKVTGALGSGDREREREDDDLKDKHITIKKKKR